VAAADRTGVALGGVLGADVGAAVAAAVDADGDAVGGRVGVDVVPGAAQAVTTRDKAEVAISRRTSDRGAMGCSMAVGRDRVGSRDGRAPIRWSRSVSAVAA
jgi:hypothetical protein